jgi:hypothetical protein
MIIRHQLYEIVFSEDEREGARKRQDVISLKSFDPLEFIFYKH